MCLYRKNHNYYAGGFTGILRNKNKNLNMKYLFAILHQQVCKIQLSKYSTGANINNLSNDISNIKVPLPPIEIQEKIVNRNGKNEIECEKLYNKNNSERRSKRTIIDNTFHNYNIKSMEIMHFS